MEKKEGHKGRPIPLNTVELLKVASKNLGLGPSTTMNIAERLYTNGYISYPRTESTSYSEHFDLQGTLKMFSRSSDW